MCRRVLTRRVGILTCAAMAGFAVASVGGTAQATLLWYDGFATTDGGGTYTAGSALGGQSGGAGTFFTGAWLQAGTNDHIVQSDSLQMPNPLNPSVGGSAGDTDTTTCCITSRSGRLMTDPWAGFTNPEGTFYIGFLANYGTGPTLHHRVLEMWEGDLGDDGNRNLQLGYSEFTGIGDTLTLRVRDEFDGAEDNYVLSEDLQFAEDNGQTHFVVLRFDLTNDDKSLGGVGDRIRVYLDPVGTSEPAVASADTGSIDFLVDTMGVITNFIFGASTAPAFDEVRIATTFEEVANGTVPEPTALGLLGLGALGLSLVSRRKRG